MSRNIKQSMDTLFEIFEDKVRASGENCTDLGKKRWIIGSKNEEEWLEKAKIIKNDIDEKQEIIFKDSQIAAIYEYDSKFYFAIIGFENIQNLPDFLNTEPLNAGIFTAIVADFKLKIQDSKTALDIIESVLFLHENDENGYKGHDFKHLTDFFPTINLYEITANCPFTNKDVYRLFGVSLSQNKTALQLPFTATTLEKFNNFLLNSNSDFPFENIVLALTASHFKFAFLDIYRCIERLYSYIAAQETYNELAITLPSLTDFVDILEKNKAWKVGETQTIEALFEKTTNENSALTQDLTTIIHEIHPDIKIGNYIYKLRNSIVHLKRKHEHLYRKLDDAQWDKLIAEILPTIEYWSKKM